MDSAPLPPHERTWRHPSELGVTAIDPEPTSPARVIAFAGGAFTIALVAALVITLTPQQSTRSTTAIGVTTIPVASARNTAVAAAESIRINTLDDISAIPSAIADVPIAALRANDALMTHAAVLPDLDDTVTVLTEQFAYPVAWRDVTRLELDDAVVVDVSGSIVARIIDGRLVASHDLLIGAAMSLED